MDALKSVCFSVSRGIGALFLSSSVSERHPYAPPHPLEVLVVAPLSACVQLSSLAYTHIGHVRVSVCDTKSDTKVTPRTRLPATSASGLLTGMKRVKVSH